jgi:integrase-like protein
MSEGSALLYPLARICAIGTIGPVWASFHAFRHTCATILFRHRLNAKQVQMWLGHHSPAFMLATYVQLLPDDLPDAGFLGGLTRRNAAESISEDVITTFDGTAAGSIRPFGTAVAAHA